MRLRAETLNYDYCRCDSLGGRCSAYSLAVRMDMKRASVVGWQQAPQHCFLGRRSFKAISDCGPSAQKPMLLSHKLSSAQHEFPGRLPINGEEQVICPYLHGCIICCIAVMEAIMSACRSTACSCRNNMPSQSIRSSQLCSDSRTDSLSTATRSRRIALHHAWHPAATAARTTAI